MPTTVASAGWSFLSNPVNNSGTVTYTFDGPPTTHTIEARLYGLKNGQQGQGYFADSDAYAPYDGNPKDVTQVFTQGADTFYSVVIYDVTAGREVLSYLFYRAWQVIGRVPIPSKFGYPAQDADKKIIGWEFHGGPKEVKRLVAARIWGDDDRLYIPDTSTEDAPSVQARSYMRYGRERRKRHFVTAEIFQPDYTEPNVLVNKSIVANRIWGGIGGFSYIPSFPQLNRRNTTWPHAT